MKYKLLKGVLAVTLGSLLLTGCNNSNKAATTNKSAKVEAMTKDKITLTYATPDDQDIGRALADEFEKKYPNITVNLVTVDEGGWNDGLTNMAGAGTMPDVFWYQGDSDSGIRNGWFTDITKYWNADIEAKDVLTTLQNQGKFDGKHKLAAAVQVQPECVYLNTNVFKTLNEKMPATDWTYDEMIDLMQTMTVPEKGIFGYTVGSSQITTYATIVNSDAIGEYGWNGKKYDLTTDWAKAMQQQADYVRTGVRTPTQGSDEALAAFGDKDIWAALTGKVAIVLDGWGTASRMASKEFTDRGLAYVPYAVPKGAKAKTLNKPAYVDMAAVSTSCEHPREAYELLKFMGWSKDGWQKKMELFKSLKNDDGTARYIIPIEIPITLDEEIWKKFSTLVPDNKYYQDFLKQVKWPIPLASDVLPGFSTFMNEVYFGGEYGNVEEAITNGEVTAADVAQDLTDQANRSMKDVMEELFNQ